MRKFNWLFFLALTIIMGVNLTSCKKSLTEEEALKLQNELDTTDAVKIGYSVVLVDAANTTILKSAEEATSFSGAVVSIAQNGEIKTKTVTDTMGVDMVTFSGLKYGTATVNIMMDGYSEVNYTIDLTDVAITSFSESYDGIRTYNASNIIPMLSLDETDMATIEGTVTVETDLTNTAPEAANGVTVLAMLYVYSDAFDDAIDNDYIINHFSYGDVSMTTTTDANGSYSISVPAPTNEVMYYIVVPKHISQQTMYDSYETDSVIFRSYTKNTAFGFGSDNSVSTSDIPVVSPLAIVTFSDPDYFYTDAILGTPAIADDQAIGSATIADLGSGYAPGLTFTYVIPNTAANATNGYADAYATAYVSNDGHVYRTDIASGGDNMPATTVNTQQSVPFYNYLALYQVTAVTAGNGLQDGGLALVDGDGGEYFSDNEDALSVSTIVGTGSGANVDFTLSNAGGYYTITGYDVDENAPGSGYAVNDTIQIRINLSTTAKVDYAYAGGEIDAIAVTNPGSNYVSGEVDVVITGDGEGAAATATVDNGEIRYITITDGGTNYTTANAIIKNTYEPMPARASIPNYYVVNTRVVDVDFDFAGTGYGYTNVAPTATITSNIVSGPGGGATLDVELDEVSHNIQSIDLTGHGMNYRGNIPEYRQSATMNGSSSSSITISAGTTYRADIYLGTGELVPEVDDYEY